jgi:hypothetical protein
MRKKYYCTQSLWSPTGYARMHSPPPQIQAASALCDGMHATSSTRLGRHHAHTMHLQLLCQTIHAVPIPTANTVPVVHSVPIDRCHATPQATPNTTYCAIGHICCWPAQLAPESLASVWGWAPLFAYRVGHRKQEARQGGPHIYAVPMPDFSPNGKSCANEQPCYKAK